MYYPIQPRKNTLTYQKFANHRKGTRRANYTEKNSKILWRLSIGPSLAPLKVSLPSKYGIIFGYWLSLYLMYLEGNAVSQIVSTATRFSAATLWDSQGMNYGQNVEGIWLTFVKTWCTMYTRYPTGVSGMPHGMGLRTYEGYFLTSEKWKDIKNMIGTEIIVSRVKPTSTW